MSDCLCDQCAALCCRYFALPIDNPKTARQFDDIRWYLIHENVVVFIEKKQWYLGVLNKCKHLQADNRCGIYETRPKICRGYSTDNCDYHGGDYGWEKLFTSGEQLREYGLAYLKKRRAKRKAVKIEKNVDRPARAGKAGKPELRRRAGVKGHPSLRRNGVAKDSSKNGAGTPTIEVLSRRNGAARVRLPVLRGS